MTLDSCKIPLQEDSTGTIRLENTRVTLDTVVLAFAEGATAEEIADRFPAVSLGAIYAAITFYLQNQNEVDAYLARRQADSEQIRMKIEARPQAKQFRERLLARVAGGGKS